MYRFMLSKDKPKIRQFHCVFKAVEVEQIGLICPFNLSGELYFPKLMSTVILIKILQ